MRLVSARSRVRSSLEAVRVGVVGNISACHADAPGSIPGRGDVFLGSKPCCAPAFFFEMVRDFFFDNMFNFFAECSTFFLVGVQQAEFQE